MFKKTLLFIWILLLAACAPAASETLVETVVVTAVVEGEPAFSATQMVAEEAPYDPGAPPPHDNFFQDYGLNPFVDPAEDPLSTFAIDVDTASYSVARRYVQDGLLPPPEAVRPEEFVNYFDPGYAPPPEIAFALFADGAPSPFHQDGTHFIRFGVQGYEVPDSERKPANLTFVIDTSGSMARENRLELVKDALDLLLARLDQRDTVAIVEYGTQARVVLRPTNAADRHAIAAAYHALYPESSTNAEAGLRLGYQLAWEMVDLQASNRVVLLSDGVANVGATGPEAILETIGQYAESGITLTSIGVGMGNFNDVLLEQLANQGDGNYAYIDTLDEARKVFVEDLAGTLQVIAREAKIQVEFNPQTVSRYRLIGYENRAIADESFRDDSVDAGEIGAGHSVVALYAVELQPDASGWLATMRLRWQDPDTREVIEIDGQVGTQHLARSFEEAGPHYQLAVLVLQYAELLRRSPYLQGTTFDQIAGYAFQLIDLLPEDMELREFAQLVAQAGGLQ